MENTAISKIAQVRNVNHLLYVWMMSVFQNLGAILAGIAGKMKIASGENAVLPALRMSALDGTNTVPCCGLRGECVLRARIAYPAEMTVKPATTAHSRRNVKFCRPPVPWGMVCLEGIVTA